MNVNRLTKYWSCKNDGDWICMTCEHFTINEQDYCAGCGRIKGEDLAWENSKTEKD